MKGPESDQGRHALSGIYLTADSVLPHFPATKPAARLSNQIQHPARKEPWMRRRLRRSLPFLLAIFFGMIAGVLVAGVAIVAAHP
jgi:hypothetical protein